MVVNTKKMNKKRVRSGLPWIALGLLILIVVVGYAFNPTMRTLLQSVRKSVDYAPISPDPVEADQSPRDPVLSLPPHPAPLKKDETLMQIEARLRKEYDQKLNTELAKEREKAKVGREETQEPTPPVVMFAMPRGIVSDITNLSNGIPLRTEVLYDTGETALEERQLHDSYTATYQLKMRIPRPTISILDIEKATPELSKILPGFTALFPLGFVSPAHEMLYRNKISDLRTNSRQLGALLSKPNAYDCNTILHLTNKKGRKVFFMQADMDAILKGSDGDRAPVMPASQVDSIDYDPFTVYQWAKTGKAPNPMIAGWERRIAIGKKELDAPAITPERKAWVNERLVMLKAAIEAMKKRSYLISAHDPYIVLPLSILKDAKDPYAPKVGDYAVVISGRKIYPCLVGDAGTDTQVGEASARMAVALVPGWNITQKAVAYPGVSYLVFPGSREVATAVPDHKKWGAKCLTLLGEIGGLGNSYELHDWTTPARAPVPVPPPADTKPPAPPEKKDPAPSPKPARNLNPQD